MEKDSGLSAGATRVSGQAAAAGRRSPALSGLAGERSAAAISSSDTDSG